MLDRRDRAALADTIDSQKRPDALAAVDSKRDSSNDRAALDATVDSRKDGDATVDSRKDGAFDATVDSRNARSAAGSHDARVSAYADTVFPRDDDHVALVPVDPTHYRLAKELARGGMGRIHLARDRRLGRIVAVKELLVRDGELALRFEREARITARLQHPSIVSVYEAGLWPSGFPFYAMPRVNGRSLDEVVAETRTLEQRLALVPNVLAVADAIAYAHGERVIHRDLKPKNVLVGSFGETVVIDWGLAKDLTSAAPEPSAGPYRSAGSGLETGVGEVMGTPAYMPPEQAEGETVDERADVYAIGALLLHVLTGKPPYEGRTAVEVLDAVRHDPPASVREREPNVLPDLVAIVERTMARNAADRYPTARELAEDLRRFQTGQLVGAHHYSLGQLVRRFIARHRAPISVGAAAAVVLAVVGAISVRRVIAERGRADAQRVVAESNRARADELTDFMLFDLRQKLEPVGKLDLLDVVARKASSYYDTRTDLDVVKRAAALENIGDVLVAKGDVRGAREQFSRVLGMRTATAFAAPFDDDAQLGLVTSYMKLGDVIETQGNRGGGALLYERALAMVEPRATTLRWQRELVGIQLRIADVQKRRGDSDGAAARLESTLASSKQATTNHPLDSDLIHQQARVESQLATVYRETAIPTALTHRRAALALLEKLSAQAPDDTSLLVELGAETTSLGDELEIAGDAAKQLAAYRAALAVVERLVAHDPTNAKWKATLSETLQQVGRALSTSGDLAAGLAFHRRALEVTKPLLERDPTNGVAISRLAEVHHAIAEAYRNSKYVAGRSNGDDGDALNKAIAEYRIAISLGDRIVKLDPTNRTALRNVAMARSELAQALTMTKDFDAAATEFHDALEDSEQLSAIDPSNLWWRADIAYIHLSLGSLLRQIGDVDGCLAEQRKALAISEGNAARDAANVQWARDTVTAHMFMGHAQYDRRQNRDEAVAALAEYNAALDVTKRLAAAAPDDKATAAAVASLENRVALAQKLIGTFDHPKKQPARSKGKPRRR